MKLLFGASIVLLLVFVCGCGGGRTPVDASGDASADSTADACAASPCASLHGPCGFATSSCGTSASCGFCRFGTDVSTLMGSAATVRFARAPDGSISAAYNVFGSPLSIVRHAGGAWTTDTAPTMAVDHFDFAIGADGTRWLAYTDSSDVLHIARATTGGAWSDDDTVMIDRSAPAPAIAVATDGTPYVAYFPQMPPSTLVVAHRNGTSWTSESVAMIASPTNMQFTLTAAAQPALAWHVDAAGDSTIHLAERSASGWTTSSFTSSSTFTGYLVMVLDDDGNPVVVTGDNSVVLYWRENGTWTNATVAAREHPENGAIAIAPAPTGEVWITWASSSGAWLAEYGRSSSVVAMQHLHTDCFSSGMGVWLDGTQQLTLADTCPSGGAPEAHVQQGMYDASYDAQCTQIGTALCAQACMCGGSQACCWSYQGPGSSGDDCVPHPCDPDFFAARMCGVIGADSNLATCAMQASTAMCAVANGHNGAALPMSCADEY